MSGSATRHDAIEAVQAYQILDKDFAEPLGRLFGKNVFDLSTMMASHLRQSRRDRILRGQAAARAMAIRLGRPPIGKAKVEKAKRELAAGKGVRQVARLAGISAASVSRLKNSMLLATTT